MNFFKPVGSNNTTLKINVTGKCILIYEDMFRGSGDLAIKLDKTEDSVDIINFINMDYSNWTNQRIRDEFSINSTTYLSISTSNSLLLDGVGADVQKLRLYVISDSTYKSFFR